MFRRQVAWRSFIEELKRSKYIHEEEVEDRTVRYLVSPFGALINRIFLVGTLTDIVESKERKSIKARVSDITGVISIYAGEFQPDVYTFLKLLNSEVTIVMLTAKVRIFEPEEGRKIPIIRPEWIKKADLESRNAWLIDAASNTIERLNYIEKLATSYEGEINDQALMDLQVPFYYWKPFKIAFDYYTPEEILKEVEEYKLVLRESLTYVSDLMKEKLEGIEFELETFEEEEAEETYEEETYEGELSLLERAIIEAIKELDTGLGAPWNEVVARVQKITGATRSAIEATIEDLLTRAEIFESARGRLKTFS